MVIEWRLWAQGLQLPRKRKGLKRFQRRTSSRQMMNSFLPLCEAFSEEYAPWLQVSLGLLDAGKVDERESGSPDHFAEEGVIQGVGGVGGRVVVRVAEIGGVGELESGDAGPPEGEGVAAGKVAGGGGKNEHTGTPKRDAARGGGGVGV